MDLPSFFDIFRIGKSEALIRNGLLSASEIDRKGSDLNILFAAASAMADECVGQLAGNVRPLLIAATQSVLGSSRYY